MTKKVSVVTNLPPPPPLTPEVIAEIREEARQWREAFGKIIRRMESGIDWRLRAR